MYLEKYNLKGRNAIVTGGGRGIGLACAATPAALLGLAGTLGSLAAGATADVAIVKLVTKDRTLPNGLGESMVIPKLFVPQMTILDGQVVFRQVDFC